MIQNTPGVYIQELNAFPPSVPAVATSVPTFIGCTETYTGSTPQFYEINSLKDFEAQCGFAPPPTVTSYTAATADAAATAEVSLPAAVNGLPKYYLYFAIQHFYANGGGTCHVCAVADQTSTGAPTATSYTNAIDALAGKHDHQLLVFCDLLTVLPDAVLDVYQHALQQCALSKFQFCIFDVATTTSGADTPGTKVSNDMTAFRAKGMGSDDQPTYGAAYYPYLQTSLQYNVPDSSIVITSGTTLADLKASSDAADKAKYATVKAALLATMKANPLMLPPAPAMAGIYNTVDHAQGVWRAPANTGVLMVNEPAVRISDDAQGNMNNPVGGIAVNAIRQFHGQGTVVWGARTLKSNDENWKYIPVRRLAIMIEQSLKLALHPYVFQPNDANTWTSVREMVSNFLTGLWQDGALTGDTVAQAFYVHCGEPSTMTATDIEEGKMIVQIGFAPVRPTEFITLTFTQIAQVG